MYNCLLHSLLVTMGVQGRNIMSVEDLTGQNYFLSTQIKVLSTMTRTPVPAHQTQLMLHTASTFKHFTAMMQKKNNFDQNSSGTCR